MFTGRQRAPLPARSRGSDRPLYEGRPAYAEASARQARPPESVPWSGMEEIPVEKADRIIKEAQSNAFLEPGDLAPTWETIPPHIRATYIKLAARDIELAGITAI